MSTFERIDDQRYYDLSETSFVPMGLRMLIELDVGKIDTNLILTTGNYHNMQTGRVRMISPHLPDVFFSSILPDGNGSFGERLLVPEAATRALDDQVYQEMGLEVPSADASDKRGELALIPISRAIGRVPEDHDGPLPFIPLGARIFFEFDYDDQGVGVVGMESGKKYDRQSTDELGEIVVPESAKAQQDNLATVTAVGPEAQELSKGMRVFPPARYQSVIYDDEPYYFVKDESKVMGFIDFADEASA